MVTWMWWAACIPDVVPVRLVEPPPMAATEAEPGPAWEYMLAVPTGVSGKGVMLQFEDSAGHAMVPEVIATAALIEGSAWKGPDGAAVSFRTAAEALSFLGRDRWEVVAFLGKGQYLLKRQVID